MKRVVIDCRYLQKSGIGRVNLGFLENMDCFFQEYEVLFLGNNVLLNKYRKETILEDFNNPFSFKGLFLSRQILKEINKCDCFVTFGYSIPFGIRIKKISFIHDCIPFDVKKTNKHFVDYLVKRILHKRALKSSSVVFTISKFSKTRILKNFGNKYSNKIIVVPLGLTNDILKYENTEKPKRDYFLFIGNFKEQKGIDILLNAFSIYREQGGNLKLFLVGRLTGLRTSYKGIMDLDDNNIIVKQNVDDKALLSLIHNAYCLIQPSRYEGYGLPPLEALYLGTPVILNDIPVFREIYEKQNVTFFKQNDFNDLAKKMALPFQTNVFNQNLTVTNSYSQMVSIIFDLVRGL